MKLQPLDPKLDREATVNDLRSILDEIASQGGGSLPVSIFYYDRDEGSNNSESIWISDLSVQANPDDKRMELRIGEGRK
jgi:hypothetical protein